MPYIKPTLRPLFDSIYYNATYLETRFDLFTVNSLTNSFFDALGEIEPRKRTGCMNYFFTRIIRDCFNPKTSDLLLQIFCRYFLQEQSYENYEKAAGFLYRLKHEFSRRNWYPQGRTLTPNNIKFLDKLFSLLNEDCDKFEDYKKEENGDV